jgi:hypothetical protein
VKIRWQIKSRNSVKVAQRVEERINENLKGNIPRKHNLEDDSNGFYKK